MFSILRVHSNHSLCPSVPKFTDLICSVNQNPGRKKVASILVYMCRRLRVHSTIHFVRPYPNLLTFYVQYTKTLAVKKWLPSELICALGLEYIFTIHFVRLTVSLGKGLVSKGKQHHKHTALETQSHTQ